MLINISVIFTTIVAVTICSYTSSMIPTKHFQSFAGIRMFRGTVWVSGFLRGWAGAGGPTTVTQTRV